EITGASVEEFEEEEHFSWQAALSRVTWLSVNVVAGLILALLLNQLVGSILTVNAAHLQLSGLMAGLRSHVALDGIVCLLPMFLLTSGSVGSQALGVAGLQLGTDRGRDFRRFVFRVVLLGTVGGVVAMIVSGLVTTMMFISTS